jgi:hypothetical protein
MQGNSHEMLIKVKGAMYKWDHNIEGFAVFCFLNQFNPSMHDISDIFESDFLENFVKNDLLLDRILVLTFWRSIDLKNNVRS